MTQMTVQLCDGILCDCIVMFNRGLLRHNRKAFLNNNSFVMLFCWVYNLHQTARFRQHNLEIPHSSLTSSLSQLLMLRLVVAVCGTKTGLH